jgi:hypothetical protein
MDAAPNTSFEILPIPPATLVKMTTSLDLLAKSEAWIDNG